VWHGIRTLYRTYLLQSLCLFSGTNLRTLDSCKQCFIFSDLRTDKAAATAQKISQESKGEVPKVFALRGPQRAMIDRATELTFGDSFKGRSTSITEKHTRQQGPQDCSECGPWQMLLHWIHLCAAWQKSASNTNPLDSSAPPCVANNDITPAFWHSPTLFSKKFVLSCKDTCSIQSNGLEAP